MKVWVVCKARAFGAEKIYGVFISRKAAEKAIRKDWPLIQKYDNNTYADLKNGWLFFFHEMEVKE